MPVIVSHGRYSTPVYQALLTRRYLTRRIMPLLAVVAVMLSVAMVLITWSVMGGFLNVLLDSGRTLIGDVKVQWAGRGFAHYDDLVDRLERDDLVASAAPAIETFGIVTLPSGMTREAMVFGIEPQSYERVTKFARTLHWRPIDGPVKGDTEGKDYRLEPLADLTERLDWGDLDATAWSRVLGWTWEDLLGFGTTLTKPDPATGESKPAVNLGIELSRLNRREAGWYTMLMPRRTLEDGSTEDVRVGMPINGTITLRVLPLDTKGSAIEMSSRIMPVANEFKTGNFQFDQRLVLVRLDVLQDMLHMDRAKRVIGEYPSPDGFGIEYETVEDPARVTTVLVRAIEGVDANELAGRVRAIYAEFAQAHPGVPDPDIITIATWEELNAEFIGAVRKEIGLVLFVFSFVSLTAVFLVLAIFWSMVSEKTKDIGVLRSLGASRLGIAWLWLRYGLAIGLSGSILGTALAWVIVTNINPIHDWMGKALGLTIWDPSVYYFTDIPSQVDPTKAAIVLAGGAISSLVGALLPAVRSARMDPVRALRFE